MSTVSLNNQQWIKIVEFLRACPNIYVGQEDQCRRFTEGVLWIARSGSQWRLFPAKYSHWNSVYIRFARWADKNVWHILHLHLADDPDMEHLILDSTIIRAYPCAARASKQRTGRTSVRSQSRRLQHQSSRQCRRVGQSPHFILTTGQRHNCTQAEALIIDLDFERLIADKAYDIDDLIELIIEEYEAEEVIPPRAKREEPRGHDAHIYKERHLVKCLINKI